MEVWRWNVIASGAEMLAGFANPIHTESLFTSSSHELLTKTYPLVEYPNGCCGDNKREPRMGLNTSHLSRNCNASNGSDKDSNSGWQYRCGLGSSRPFDRVTNAPEMGKLDYILLLGLRQHPNHHPYEALASSMSV
jgi:hypothetical protein